MEVVVVVVVVGRKSGARVKRLEKVVDADRPGAAAATEKRDPAGLSIASHGIKSERASSVLFHHQAESHVPV